VQFPLTQIFSVDGSKRSAHSNAYFYGFFNSKRIVLYDTLLKQVTLDELLAILGHEIGHWKLWHTLQNFVVTQCYTLVLLLCFSFVQHTPALFTAFGFAYSGPMPVFIGLMLFSQTFWGPVDKALSLGMTINSRRNEFAADAFAVQLHRGEALVAGLIKISTENLDNLVPDGWYSWYHYSHPPLVERIAAIEDRRRKGQ
jgi:STE24 endopeptidase